MRTSGGRLRDGERVFELSSGRRSGEEFERGDRIGVVRVRAP
jgi:hypothetical protein